MNIKSLLAAALLAPLAAFALLPSAAFAQSGLSTFDGYAPSAPAPVDVKAAFPVPLVIPGNPYCQFLLEQGFTLRGPFTATDAFTGDVVFSVKGTFATVNGPVCVNAPDGHALKVSAE